MGKVKNFIGNTLGVGSRGAVATPIIAGLDTLRGIGNGIGNMGDVIKKTSSNLKEILLSPYAKGPMKWYHRVGGALSSPFIAGAALIEGTVRTILEPGKNLVLNTRDILGNGFKNIGESILWAFDTTRPVSDFSFQHLALKPVAETHYTSRAMRWKK